MINFTLAKCKTNATFSATLAKQQKLQLNAIKNAFEVVLETPVLLVVKIKEVEIVVHGYGKLLFKNCDDVPLMEEIAQEIYEAGLKENGAPGRN